MRVWAWFTAAGYGIIRRVNLMSHESYLNLLDSALIPDIWACYGLETMILLSDPSPQFPQSFNSSLFHFQDWFKDHPEVKLEYFPMKSEDLNPFKIVWNEFVGALRLQRLQPKDAEEIWAGIEELWFFRSSRLSYWEGLFQSFRADLKKKL